MSNEPYDSKADTLEHIHHVRDGIGRVIVELTRRSEVHDRTKLEEHEKSLFDEYTPKLRDCEFGSEEYEEYRAALGKALEHHYAHHRHHPEYFKEGMQGMNLIDLIEMMVDWYASTKRRADGDVMRSIDVLQERFGYSDEMKKIFQNTAEWLKSLESPRRDGPRE